MLLANQIAASYFSKMNELINLLFFHTSTSSENMIIFKIFSLNLVKKMHVVMLMANQIATFLYQLHKLFLTNCFCHCKHVSLSSLTKADSH